jgi:hypothetical protein
MSTFHGVFGGLMMLLGMAASGIAQPAYPLTIVSPTSGTVVSPGQALTISVTADSGVYPNGTTMFVTGAGPIGSAGPLTGSSGDFSLTIPTNADLGVYNVTALAKDSSGNPVTSLPITLDIERSDYPTGGRVSPLSFSFAYIGDSVSFDVDGTFSDGVVTLDKSTLAIFSTDNTNVAIVQNRRLIATGPGRTYLEVSYGAFPSPLTKALVIVKPSRVRGDLNGDGRVDQDDVNILQSALNTAATTPNDSRDLNQDGLINGADLSILQSLCTKPSCQ